MMDKMRAGLKSYWFVGVIGIVIVLMMWYTSNQSKKIDTLVSDVATMEELLAGAKRTQSSIDKDFDAKQHSEVLEGRTVSAEKIAQEIIDVDNKLTAFYKTNEPLPEDEAEKKAIFKQLADAQVENTRLTGATEADHIKTWQLNPAWTLKLESVVIYQDTESVPLLFSMTTKDGKAAGLIVATYDVKAYKLTNITRHYTTDGLKDEVDVGGI